jgi:hypothetical protein
MTKETAQEVINALNEVLEHGHGGGNFRRLLIMQIAKYEQVLKDFSAQKDH